MRIQVRFMIERIAELDGRGASDVTPMSQGGGRNGIERDHSPVWNLREVQSGNEL